MPIKNQIQLITYPDSMGGTLSQMNEILIKHFLDAIKGIHILPFFPSSADRGFAPTTYYEVEPTFGNWEDIQLLSKNFQLVADVMVNHLSRQSEQFKDFVKHGRKSPWADLFVTIEKIWPDKNPSAEDIAKVFLRKPEHPFTTITIEETGEKEIVWSSFGKHVDYSEQMDLDILSPVTQKFLKDSITFLAKQNIEMLRLDAIGYVTKKAGTSCFFLEPEIYDRTDEIVAMCDEVGIEILPEVHAHHSLQRKLSEHGYWVYDFILPALILHTLFNEDSTKLQSYLETCPRKQVTMLDCHDGIPIQPDVDDILDVSESKAIVDRLQKQAGTNLSLILAKQKTYDNFDVHQIRCTYYSAVDCHDDSYVAARAIQLFAPGVPQVYYVGLLAGKNDLERYEAMEDGKEVNRHCYTAEEVEADLKRSVVQRQLKLMKFRNQHPAFQGSFAVESTSPQQVQLRWQNGAQHCTLSVDLNTVTSTIEFTNEHGALETFNV